MNGVKPSGDILSPVLSFLGWQFDDTGFHLMTLLSTAQQIHKTTNNQDPGDWNGLGHWSVLSVYSVYRNCSVFQFGSVTLGR